MASILDLVKKQREGNKGLVGSIGTAIGQKTMEKLDVRNYLFKQGGILNALFPGIKGYKIPELGKKSKDPTDLSTAMNEAVLMKLDTINKTMSLVSKHTTAIPILTKNSMVIPMMARDANITRQGVIKMVKLLGGKQENKADMFFKRASDREKEYESKYGKEAKKGSSATATPMGSGKENGKEKGGFLSSILGGVGAAASGLGKGVGIAGMLSGLGLGIGGFLAGIAVGGKAIKEFGNTGAIKQMMVDLAEGLGAFSGTSLMALGALLAPGMLFGMMKGMGAVKGSLGVATGMSAVGLGLGGFFAGLALGGSGVDMFGNSGAIKQMMIDLAEGLNAFSGAGFAALGTLLGAGALFGAVGGAGMAGEASLGIAAIGLGLGGFFAGLAAGGSLVDMFGNSGAVKQMMIDLAEGLNAFSGGGLATIGALLGAGALFGVVGGPTVAGKAALGMSAIGLGLGGFFAGLAVGGKVVEFFNSSGAIKQMMVDLAEGLNALATVDGMNLLKFSGGLAALGPSMLLFLGSQGIGGIIESVKGGLSSIFNSIFGTKNEDKKSLLQKIVESLKPLEEINTTKIGEGAKALSDLSTAIKNFSSISDKELAQAIKVANFAKTISGTAPVTVPTAPLAPPSAPSAAALAETSAESQRRTALARPAATPTPVSTSATTTTKPTPTSPASRTQTGISDTLVNFVKSKEGFSAKAVWDYQQYSNGYGTKANSADEIIDEAEAERRLRSELEKSQKIVVDYGRKKGYEWNQNQIDGLTSFIYNLGPGALNQVTANGTRSNTQIAEAIVKYNKAGGKELAGLTARRKEELAMFNALPLATSTATQVAAASGSKTPSSATGATSTTSATSTEVKRGESLNAASTQVADAKTVPPVINVNAPPAAPPQQVAQQSVIATPARGVVDKDLMEQLFRRASSEYGSLFG